MHGDDGPDIMIGGLGRDLFYGNTADDLIYSDGYAGIFRAEWNDGGFAGESGQRFLYTSNFAGPGAVDVVSAAQQKDSIGNPLDLIAKQRDDYALAGSIIAQQFISAGYSGQAYGSLDDPHFVNKLLDYLGSDRFIQAVADLTARGADIDVIRAALIPAVMNDLATFWDYDSPAYEMLIEQLIDYLLSKANAEDDSAELRQLDQSDAVGEDYAALSIAAE